MGLIKAAMGAAGGVLADQWKEYFYCEAIPSDVLAVKGKKKVTGRSSNTKGDDNIITNGSLIAIADGQCMLIVEQGKVVDGSAGLLLQHQGADGQQVRHPQPRPLPGGGPAGWHRH